MRTIDSRLTHRIVRSIDGYAKGATIEEAKAVWRRLHKKEVPEDIQVWAVTRDTVISENGDFLVRGKFVQPADITGEKEIRYE